MLTRPDLERMHRALDDTTVAAGDLSDARVVRNQADSEAAGRRVADGIARLASLLPADDIAAEMVIACAKLERAIRESDEEGIEIFRIQIEQEIVIMKERLRGFAAS